MVSKFLSMGMLCLFQATHGFQTSLSLRDFREQMRRVADGTSEAAAVSARDADGLLDVYPTYNISTPIDHFHNDSTYEPHSNGSFPLRYWFDASHYRPGGPVIVLLGGETSGVDRLPFMQKGILAKLAAATHGIGVVLEHRYYGASVPTADLSAASLRFLSTDQSLADMAHFARHAVFPGPGLHAGADLSAPGTPYVAYGGSYAGALAAFVRVLYPDLYWGAIASSAVTEAVVDYCAYYEAARLFGPAACVDATQKLTHVLDNAMAGRHGAAWSGRLKAAFGLGGLARDEDFAEAVSGGIAGLQATNWDPKVNSTGFGLYCGNVSSEALLYPELEGQRGEARALIAAGGYGDEVDALENRMLNYIGWVNATVVAPCEREGKTQEHCYSNYNSTFYAQDDLSQAWRAWPYQYCTEWGYFQTGSGAPATQPPLISRLIDLNHTSTVCREAFNISTPPNTTSINRHGGLGIRYPRLAFVDGERDPWRAATPHAIGREERVSTREEPFVLIDEGVHHWDENGVWEHERVLGKVPPESVEEAQEVEVWAVRGWIDEWRRRQGRPGQPSDVDGGTAADDGSSPEAGKSVDEWADL